jgi:uncharacterized protein (TIGR03435 family)
MTTRVSGLIALLTVAGLGQSFEAASLKLSGPQSQRGEGGGPGTNDPGQYVYQRVGVGELIGIAWHIDASFQISSKFPLDEPSYDLIAKVPAGATRDQFRIMMQNLLAERFHLKLHIVQREFSGYALQQAKSGSKLKESVPGADLQVDSRVPTPPQRGISSRQHLSEGYLIVNMVGREATIAGIASFLRLPDEPTIVDKTGLTAKYDFTFEYSRELPSAVHNGAAQPPAIPDLLIALQQQLGLQLVRQKLPFDVLIIDAIDPKPTDN